MNAIRVGESHKSRSPCRSMSDGIGVKAAMPLSPAAFLKDCTFTENKDCKQGLGLV